MASFPKLRLLGVDDGISHYVKQPTCLFERIKRSLMDIFYVLTKPWQGNIIRLITGNSHKYHEYMSVLKHFTVEMLPMPNLFTRETDLDALSELAVGRLSLAYGFRLIPTQLMIEETFITVYNDEGDVILKGPYKTLIESHCGREMFAERYHGMKIVMQNSIAYTRDGINYYAIENKVTGFITVPRTSNPDACGWDVFTEAPECKGTGTTFFDLNSRAEDAVGMRKFPIYKLSHSVIYPEHKIIPDTCVYEVHITVQNDGEALVPSESFLKNFQDFCSKYGNRSLYIFENSRNGEHVELQSAVYKTYGSQTEAINYAEWLKGKCTLDGFTVVSCRVEAMAFNNNIPSSNEEASKKHLRPYYFEFHARITDKEIDGIEDFITNYCCDDDGVRKIFMSRVKTENRLFLNARFYSGYDNSLGRENAIKQWNTKLEQIEEFMGEPIQKHVPLEYCIYENICQDYWTKLEETKQKKLQLGDVFE